MEALILHRLDVSHYNMHGNMKCVTTNNHTLRHTSNLKEGRCRTHQKIHYPSTGLNSTRNVNASSTAKSTEIAGHRCKNHELVKKWLALQTRTGRQCTIQPTSTKHVSYDVNENRRGLTMDFLKLPTDPRTWTPCDVATWINHMTVTHNLHIDPSYFQMNGRGLCLMSLTGFLFRVPDYGKLLYDDFRERLKCCLLQPGNKARQSPGNETTQR